MPKAVGATGHCCGQECPRSGKIFAERDDVWREHCKGAKVLKNFIVCLGHHLLVMRKRQAALVPVSPY
jgi:hypothetical protein